MVRAEDENRPAFIKDAPAENFAQGILEVELPEDQFGPKKQGKVRDIWEVGNKLAIVSTDRKSAYDKTICTVPGTGAVLNLLSAWWFDRTGFMIPNHLIDVIHPNVTIARKMRIVLPVEVVWRSYLERSKTSTSLYYNYADLGRRNIYGIDFKEGLKPNQALPMGSVLTPTTKAESGHDLELTEEQAREIVRIATGRDAWGEIVERTEKLYQFGVETCRKKGLIMSSTKYELGIDEDGKLTLIDEVHTPDSSRFWQLDTYEERFYSGEDPDNFDKEILRKFLAEYGFRGEGPIPIIPELVISRMTEAYSWPFEILTGTKLPDPSVSEHAAKSIESYFKAA